MNHVQSTSRYLVFSVLLAAIAIWAMVNAYAFSSQNAIPLVQADAWIFLDTYVRKYLEGHFGWKDLFLQGHASDTNFPLHKLILLFHVNHFHMDFRIEGLVGVASGILLVLLMAATSAGWNPLRWDIAGWLLLAWLALVVLSLNSSNVYTWPLATLWFLNILMVAIYQAWMARPRGALAAATATVVLGLLVDEVALIAVLSAALAMVVIRDARPLRSSLMQAGGALVGLTVARGLYAWFNAASGVPTALAETPGMLQGLVGLLSADGLHLILIPLADSLVHVHALQQWFPARHALVATAIGSALLAAHLVFWWVAFRTPRDASLPVVRTRRLAVALMLLFYGTLAGIALQRVPQFGIEYLHQPRYVLFYQLNLAALGLMAYSALAGRAAPLRLRGGVSVALVAVLATSVLQWYLSQRSRNEAKYLPAYLQGAALTMGTLAIDSAAQIPCADILRVCDFPPGGRHRMMELLQVYRLNLFDPEFQARHQLYPFPPSAGGRIEPPIVR